MGEIAEGRKVLYFKPGCAPAHLPEHLNEEIHAAGWIVDTTSDVQVARGLLEDNQYRVGLALFDDCRYKMHHDVEELFLSCAQTEWVALLKAACLDQTELRQLIRATFFDYHTLPADPKRLLCSLGHAWGMAALQGPSDHAELRTGEFEMVGTSDVMQDLFRGIRKIASVDAPVLITGASGTGKELAALAVHERSARAKRPFVAVNCGALPANLIQTELFGHEKGSFTGAAARKLGRFESAAGGTIFLDEIGDLPLDLQVTLLRFLQEHTIERVGGTEPLPIDVRVIAATNVNLEEAVAAGKFREDLYYRLNVLHLNTPPLRDRGDDIELLARFFFNKFAREKNPGVKGFSQLALLTLRNHDWPGNVRELINRVRRAMVMCESQLIGPGDLGLEKRALRRRVMTLDQARGAAEKQAIQATLRQTKRNVTHAARQLGVSRVTLYRLMDRHGLS